MKTLDKFFSKGVKNEDPENVTKIARTIGHLIDKTAIGIFVLYKTKLLTEPITYIVPAVWGIKKDGELTHTQKEINKQIVPVIKSIFESLQLKELNEAQGFAIGFVVRDLIISKITYMIEAAKNKTAGKIIPDKESADILKDLEPLGTA